jgi:hypothetical protein
LAAWSSGIVSACHGRVIETRQGIHRLLERKEKKPLLHNMEYIASVVTGTKVF